MRVFLLATAGLVAACGPQSDLLTEDEMLAITDRAAAMGYVCSSFEEIEGGYVSDLRVGAPTLTPDGTNLCQQNRDFPYAALDDTQFLESLECSFAGDIDLTGWQCIRGVPTRGDSRDGSFDSRRP